MNKFLAQKINEPRTPAEFWCSVCDLNKVDSEKHETGRFFVIFGHAHCLETGYDGDYHGVGFAVCNECLQKLE